MNIITRLEHQTAEFHIYSVTMEGAPSRSVDVLLNFETGNISITPYLPLPRGHLKINNWIFDNLENDFAGIATLAGLSVLLGSRS